MNELFNGYINMTQINNKMYYPNETIKRFDDIMKPIRSNPLIGDQFNKAFSPNYMKMIQDTIKPIHSPMLPVMDSLRKNNILQNSQTPLSRMINENVDYRKNMISSIPNIINNDGMSAIKRTVDLSKNLGRISGVIGDKEFKKVMHGIKIPNWHNNDYLTKMNNINSYFNPMFNLKDKDISDNLNKLSGFIGKPGSSLSSTQMGFIKSFQSKYFDNGFEDTNNQKDAQKYQNANFQTNIGENINRKPKVYWNPDPDKNESDNPNLHLDKENNELKNSNETTINQTSNLLTWEYLGIYFSELKNEIQNDKEFVESALAVSALVVYIFSHLK